jgi:hypothetical protein
VSDRGSAVPPPQVSDEPPPFFRSWSRAYAAVLLYLVCLIALFAIFTRAFAP